MHTANKTKIEVIIPTYMTGQLECAIWLDAAIRSVFDQSWSHWHLTLVDDASPVTRLESLQKWAHQFPDKITLIQRPRQCGAATARMEAVAQCNADVLTFLDQDDKWLPHKLEWQVDYLAKHSEFDAVHSNVAIIDSEGQVMDGAEDASNAKRNNIDYEHISRKELACLIFRANGIRLVSSAVRRSAFVTVGGFDTSLNGGEDWEFWVRFADRYRIGHIVEPLIQRRVHDNNTSKIQRYSRTQGQLEALEKMQHAYPYLSEHIVERRQRIQNSIERLSAQ